MPIMARPEVSIVIHADRAAIVIWTRPRDWVRSPRQCSGHRLWQGAPPPMVAAVPSKASRALPEGKVAASHAEPGHPYTTPRAVAGGADAGLNGRVQRMGWGSPRAGDYRRCIGVPKAEYNRVIASNGGALECHSCGKEARL